MSLYEDFYEVIAGAVGGRVYPKAAPMDTPRPFITWRRLSSDPVVTIHGETLTTRSVFVFECWADNYLDALAVSEEVLDLIETSELDATNEPNAGDDYEPAIDVFMEPVTVGFWH